MAETTMMMDSTVYIFANTASGSCKAAKYIDLQTHQLQLMLPLGAFNVRFFNLKNPESRAQGFRDLAVMSYETTDPIRVVACGGDGSFVWVVEECLMMRVNFDNVMFCLMPFGTGNDLACSMGWGRDPPKPIIGQHLRGLKASLELWSVAEIMHFDLWKITVNTTTAGGVFKIRKLANGFERVPVMTDEGIRTSEYSRHMSNYFSIGVDARIGLGFDKKRSSSKACNRCIYLWEGLKKVCCMSTHHVQEVITTMVEGDDQVIFTNEDLDLSNPSVFVALNCKTYGGGDHQIWERATTSKHYTNKYGNREFRPQSTGDGLLEFLVFPYSISLALEQTRLTDGQGRRLYQGPGPFKLDLRKPYASTKERVYMEIDGEYFYVIDPVSVTISLADISLERKLQVLINSTTH